MPKAEKTPKVDNVRSIDLSQENRAYNLETDHWGIIEGANTFFVDLVTGTYRDVDHSGGDIISDVSGYLTGRELKTLDQMAENAFSFGDTHTNTTFNTSQDVTTLVTFNTIYEYGPSTRQYTDDANVLPSSGDSYRGDAGANQALLDYLFQLDAKYGGDFMV